MNRLKDPFGRIHDYLRISLTDKCNLRCTYCMPEDIRFINEKNILSAEEIIRIASVFVSKYGIRKIRLTGGEPLVHPQVGQIISQLADMPVKLAITTNAVLLHKFIPAFKQKGLTSINISLDTLQESKFKAITKRDYFHQVTNNIQSGIDEGFHIKLNMVVMQGMNDDEILDFISLTRSKNIHVRFIEFMPFVGNTWARDKVISQHHILELANSEFKIEKLHDEANSTSKAYKVSGWKGTFAIISTVTHPFCETCNRIRLTADGHLRNCLFDRGELNLLKPLRQGLDIEPIIEKAIQNKKERLGGLPTFDHEQELFDNLSERSMVKIGG